MLLIIAIRDKMIGLNIERKLDHLQGGGSLGWVAQGCCGNGKKICLPKPTSTQAASETPPVEHRHWTIVDPTRSCLLPKTARCSRQKCVFDCREWLPAWDTHGFTMIVYIWRWCLPWHLECFNMASLPTIWTCSARWLVDHLMYVSSNMWERPLASFTRLGSLSQIFFISSCRTVAMGIPPRYPSLHVRDAALNYECFAWICA